MPRKKEISADDLKIITELCIALADMPVEELKFNAEDESLDLREDLPFLSDILGKPATSKSTMLPVSGSHPVCIRMPARVLRAYKLKAAAKGVGYQTLMIRDLVAAVKA